MGEEKEYAPVKCECGGYYKRSKRNRLIYFCKQCGRWYNIRDYRE
jgi:uncharacterized protein YbaR (Trm112 family)